MFKGVQHPGTPEGGEARLVQVEIPLDPPGGGGVANRASQWNFSIDRHEALKIFFSFGPIFKSKLI